MPTKPANILVVDDEPGPRESLRMVLAGDYNVTCAADGQQALQLVRTTPIDLVTLDLRLPGVEGIDLLREIKALDSNIEVIVVTGYGDLHTAIESIHHGVFDYIVKPFNIAEIKMAVAKSLERRRLNVELARFFGELEAEDSLALEDRPGLSRLLRAAASAETPSLRQQMARTERLSTVGLMTASFIHEINNPLASVVALAELSLSRLRHSGRQLTEVELSLEKIIREAKRISKLATRMLSLAREHPHGAAEPTEPLALIEEALDLVRPQLARKGLKLKWQKPHSLPPVTCDADQLKQVLLNLLINAVQATPRGGTVEVQAAAQEEKWLRIVVSDTGCGIAAEHLPKVFEPFFTTKAAGEGTGLGLYICRQIVERCGGRLEAASGRGATFTLSLPVG